ncbi:MAG: hypothetical protein N3I86_14085 [Verrucomicrobiae bacterium]|nr:hypothetical protein [Verrucomicrobiae bacterium]MDW8308297.1 hypothetical protein [Verrucomicrobiales bacterium]
MKAKRSCLQINSASPQSGRTTQLSTLAIAGFGLSVLGLMLMSGLAGCGGKEKSPEIKPEHLAPINPETSADAQEKARLQQAVAIRDGIEPPPPAIKLRGGELATPEVIAAYNQELLRYVVRTRDTPESLQELMRIRELPRLPTPPPGKRIVYDPRNRIIKLDPP